MNYTVDIKPYIALASICIIWGTTYLAIRIGIMEFPPFYFSGLRFLISGILICGYFLLKGHSIPKIPELISLLISGSAICIGGNLMLCLAQKEIPSGIAAIINSGMPFWIVIFSRLMMPSEKISVTLIAGLAVGFTGQLFIFYDQLKFLAAPVYLSGLLMVFFAVMSGAFGSIYMKKNIVHTHPVFGGGIQMLLAGGITSIIGFFTGEKIPFHAAAEVWYSFFYLIVFGSIIAYSSFCYALSKLPATLVSIYAYINPIVAVFLGYLILSELITWKTITAIVITIAGIYIVKKGAKARS